MNKLLYRLEYKYSRYAIENLMYYIVGGMAVIFVMDIILSMTGIVSSLYNLLTFDTDMILKGQVWRGISFIFLYPDSSIYFMIFSLYFYYFIGTALENVWGSFRFGAYYFIGVICTIISGLIFGATTNYYLNMSLFFAFATLFPDHELMLFFFIPVKVKYLAYIDLAFFIVSFILNPLTSKVAILVAVGNYLIFFAPELTSRIKEKITHIKSKRNFR